MADPKLSAKVLSQINAIKDVLRQSALKGATLEEIQSTIKVEIPHRTLQRRLEYLRNAGAVTSSGDTRSTRYYLATSPIKVEETGTNGSVLPLSEEGQHILSLVYLPEQQRTPVGYNREFLELYQPNITNYLSVEKTDQLLRWGQTPGRNQTAGTYAKEILQRLLIDLSFNSSRLEGNTYSLLDTERLIRLGEEAENKSALEAQMILNHKDAIEFLVQSAEEIGINRYTILNLHALLANNLLPDPAAPGRLRTHEIGIGRSVYTPLAIPQLIEEMFELMLSKARQILNPFEQAFFLMVHLPYLQPFEDVNKRVSRLAANIPLNSHNLIPLSFVDVPDDLYIRGMLAVYELNRVELLRDVFVWAYERSSARYATVRQSIGEPDVFRMKYRQAMRELITAVVSSAMNQVAAGTFINHRAASIPEKEREKFIEYVETELLSLHEGNFARYYISPSEFVRWKEAWKK
ncbi:MAG TPA: Fic family protein [Patescibacteria group bacterium]